MNPPFINDNELQNIVRIKQINNSFGIKFIHNNNLNTLIPIIYENYSILKINEKKCLFTCFDYLNSTSNKYLEDQILSIAQIWEILANTFLDEKVADSKEIKLLKGLLKNNIEEWHNKNTTINYDLEFIQNRVIGSLNWEKNIKKLEKFALNQNLNIQNINLNLENLIELRNQIVHSGRFKYLGIENKNLEIYNSALLGLNVVILNKLGYNGDIISNNGGFSIVNKINHYLR